MRTAFGIGSYFGVLALCAGLGWPLRAEIVSQVIGSLEGLGQAVLSMPGFLGGYLAPWIPGYEAGLHLPLMALIGLCGGMIGWYLWKLWSEITP